MTTKLLSKRVVIVFVIGLAVLAAIGCSGLNRILFATVESVQLEDGTKYKFRTESEHIEMYEKGQWAPLFLQGVNLGAALPGHYPGELPIDKETYLRWFQKMAEMGSNVVRIYTIHPPHFYEAIVEYNKRFPKQPLYLIQGVWSPEEALSEKQDAFDPDIRRQFKQEIVQAVDAVYGKITIPETPGKASGQFTANAGPYLLAWHIGTEWDPGMVLATNERHKDMPAYVGKRFRAKAEAAPFESWLAELIDLAAERERLYGWEHPMTFTNWVTTDPLNHPGEPTFEEDMVSVDPTHLEPVNWEAGYFASYHVYPYYPDLFLFDRTLQNVRNSREMIDPYKAYLRRLKKYHEDMPIIVAEFGVPSSWGIGHIESLGRNQGGHQESEQGQINASLFNEIVEEQYAGAILFAWQDEWFKKAWNTMRFEVPEDRRPFWLNVFSNEQMFGLIGMYSSKEDVLTIDGRLDDWDKLGPDDKQCFTYDNRDVRELCATHDEAYVYLLVQMPDDFNPAKQTLYIGADTLPGGNRHAQQLGNVRLDEGLETLIVLGLDDESEVLIASNYDYHSRLYGGQIQGYDEALLKDNSGEFVPWKLAVGLEMNPPDTKISHPFEDVPAGKLTRGSTDPKSRDYHSMAAWQRRGNTIELRIPWMLFGFSDPSTKQAISYEKAANKTFVAETSKGIRFVPWAMPKTTSAPTTAGHDGNTLDVTSMPMYRWNEWHEMNYIEKMKQSYDVVKEAFLENRDRMERMWSKH